jgi:hypothetical protein
VQQRAPRLQRAAHTPPTNKKKTEGGKHVARSVESLLAAKLKRAESKRKRVFKNALDEETQSCDGHSSCSASLPLVPGGRAPTAPAHIVSARRPSAAASCSEVDPWASGAAAAGASPWGRGQGVRGRARARRSPGKKSHKPDLDTQKGMATNR